MRGRGRGRCCAPRAPPRHALPLPVSGVIGRPGPVRMCDLQGESAPYLPGAVLAPRATPGGRPAATQHAGVPT